MMYISVYPLAISIRRTNVYEEQSLGIYVDEEEENASFVGMANRVLRKAKLQQHIFIDNLDLICGIYSSAYFSFVSWNQVKYKISTITYILLFNSH